ncbi:hypothetical protein G3A50_10935 [Ancylobacter pratisalsi]|uniref:Uncharacterized protein n=1 Tax=Ancylobacter pratisalsi TaxID=1745854 RepID=A0A6P1YT51_9HYPH|nr:hypothetical protein G3A50_10935 [Ancylobacter pratisalsi]
MSRNALRYAVLLGIQTTAAAFLFWVIFPIFLRVISSIGQQQGLDLEVQLEILIGVIVLQCCYWIRLRWVPIVAPFHNVFVGHLVLFASRVSFFFGGALFSAIFFRHVPELDALPSAAQAIARAAGVLAILFALFCYSLELERLGRAIE